MTKLYKIKLILPNIITEYVTALNESEVEPLISYYQSQGYEIEVIVIN